MRRVHAGGCGLALCLALVAGGSARIAHAAGHEAAIADRFVLDVALTIAPQLSDTARQTLIAESERIWGREGVFLRWHVAGDAVRPPHGAFRVLVIARTAMPPSERSWVVGELVRLADARALAIASITGARRVLDEARRHSLVHAIPPEDYRLGLVLGRALAHEIGHYLLDTRTHSTYGLMRAGIDPREFADVRAAAAFLLDEDASRSMRARRALLVGLQLNAE